MEIAVLNHGYVRLECSMGSDSSIVRSARVSYGKDDHTAGNELSDRDIKLIHYLMKNRHTSPFESVVFTFEVKAPIFVFRQWHRHRTWSFNEISARYTELPEEYYVPELDKITVQSVNDKQQRTDTQCAKADQIRGLIDFHCEEAFEAYRSLLAWECPRELARSVLPVAAYSRMYATVDLHNLMGFLRLRLGSHAQYEIRVYAEAILKLIQPIVPFTLQAFQETL